MSRIAERRDLCGAALMKAVPTRPAVESLEEKTPAGFAVSEREERLADKVVRDARRDGEVFLELYADLFALDGDYISIPLHFTFRLGTAVDGAHGRIQFPEFHGLREGFFDRLARSDLDDGPLLVR